MGFPFGFLTLPRPRTWLLSAKTSTFCHLVDGANPTLPSRPHSHFSSKHGWQPAAVTKLGYVTEVSTLVERICSPL